MRDAFPHDPRPGSVSPISKVDEAHRTAGLKGKPFAAALPNPIRRDAGRPTRGLRSLGQRVQIRMRAAEPLAECVLR